MNTPFPFRTHSLGAMLFCALSLQLHAGLLTNPGFEAGLSGWTTANQIGSEGSFLLHTGTLSPLTGSAVLPPREGIQAAITDANGPGSHVLYQDFVVPTTLPGAAVSFSVFLINGGPDFFTPPHLDFAGTDPNPLLRINQQARIDIITTTADPFSVAPGDVLQTLFQTNAGDPLVSGHNDFSVDITPLVLARAGQTLRLRLAEVDNVALFHFGVDNVDVNIIPEPSTWTMIAGALAGLWCARRCSLRGCRR